MDRDETVSVWVSQLRAGNPEALHRLWTRYASKVQRIASTRLVGPGQRVTDEDDILVSVFDRAWIAAQQGQLDDVDDRHGFEAFLVRVTIGKVVDQRRRNGRERRGGGKVRGDSVFSPTDRSSSDGGFHRFPDQSPCPQQIAEMAEQSRQLLESLEDTELIEIANAKVEGWSNAEIAEHLHCSVATVERRLRLIRKKWETMNPDAP